MKEFIRIGHLVESFAFLPSISYNWMHKTNIAPKSWEVSFAWLYWYLAIGNIRSNLKKAGY